MIVRLIAQVAAVGLVTALVSGCKQFEEMTAEKMTDSGVTLTKVGLAETKGDSNLEPLPVLSALQDFSFTDEGGEIFGTMDLRGKVWIADFIFTRCSSTCPLQTAEKIKL